MKCLVYYKDCFYLSLTLVVVCWCL